jgi:hypothetical protein
MCFEFIGEQTATSAQNNITDWILQPRWEVLTARYELSFK